MKSEIKNVSTIAETKFLHLYDIEYKNKLGQDKNWTTVSRLDKDNYQNRIDGKSKNSDAVLIVAYHREKNKLVLVKQYRVPINEYIYEIPAGLINTGEDIAKCAKRELKEETGLELIEIHKIYKKIYISPGMTDECADIVVCTCTGNVSGEYLEDSEDIEVCMFSKDELNMIDDSMDIKTLFGIELFKSNF